MKTFALFFFLLVTLFAKGQLHLQNIHDIYKIDIDKLESYLSDDLGFTKMGTSNDQPANVYQYYNAAESIGDIIYVKVQYIPKFDKRILTLRMGDENDLKSIKSEMISDGFLYKGKMKDHNIGVYQKDNDCVMTHEKNSKDLYEINFFKCK